MNKTWALVREAAAAARAGRVASVLTVLLVAGMIVTVMLTTGRTVAAEQQVLASVDAAGTRSIIIRAEEAAGVTTEVLDRLAVLDGIEWYGALSMAIDATNTLNRDGASVPVRYAYGPQLHTLGIAEHITTPGTAAWGSALALDQLGLVDAAGAVTLTTGTELDIVGALDMPTYLAEFEPAVFAPRPDYTGDEPVSALVIIAKRPDLVSPIARAVMPLLDAADPSKVKVTTSENLAQLRALIEGQLSTFSRGLVLAVMGLTAALVAIMLLGLVMMRRKDYGRRRALGATRSLIVALIATQTLLLALVGSALGVTVGTIVLLTTGGALPGVAFTGALVVLALLTTTLAALIPGIAASRRDPIRELRVP